MPDGAAACAELCPRRNPDHQPTAWGFRLTNPQLDGHQNYEQRHDWSRLYLWDRLRGTRRRRGFWYVREYCRSIAVNGSPMPAHE